MDAMIQPYAIPGASVYGIPQMEFKVDGVSGKSYLDAITAAVFKESVAIETTAGSYVSVVRARQRKIEEVGLALAEFSKAVGRLKVKGGKSSDKAEVGNFDTVRATLNKYDISVSGLGSKMTRGDLMKAQTNVQYAIDKEDNSLQQDIVTMQSFISKRDNAYSTAAQIVKKVNSAAQNTISNAGM